MLEGVIKKKRHFQTFQEGELSLSTGAKPFCRWTGTGALRIEMRKCGSSQLETAEK